MEELIINEDTVNLFIDNHASRVARTLDSNGKYTNITYCYSCCTKVRNQKYCHECGKKLLWKEGAIDWWTTHPANPENKINTNK